MEIVQRFGSVVGSRLIRPPILSRKSRCHHALIFCALIFCALILFAFFCGSAFADVIDRIQIKQSGDEAEIQIQFITRIQYVRQVMLKTGEVRVYIYLLDIDATDPRLVASTLGSPPSNIVPRFRVTYPEVDSSLSISFGMPVEYSIRPGKDGRSISLFTPINRGGDQTHAYQSERDRMAIIPPVTPPAIKAVTRSAAETARIENEAEQLMGNANVALKNKSWPELIAILLKLLDLPLNRQSQAAQRVLGQAYESNREFAKARKEYYVYVTVYPKAKDAEQVKQSLYRMVMASYEAEQLKAEKSNYSEDMTFFGGFSQSYLKDTLRSDATVLPSGPSYTFSAVDLTQLTSSLDMTGYKHTATTDTRFVLRDSYIKRLLGMGNTNRLDAAYFEQGASDHSYVFALGRQAGGTAGAPLSYDGAKLSSNLGPTWRVNGLIGSPVALPGTTPETRKFAQISVDLMRLPGQWSGNTYFLAQKVAGILDRRAVGVEARYYDQQSNRSGLFEYDTLFKRLNIGSLQGNWNVTETTSYSLLIDHRRNLQTTNALKLGPWTQSIGDLIGSGASASSLRESALQAGSSTNQLIVGATRQFTPHVKLGVDVRSTNATASAIYDYVSGGIALIPSVRANTYTIRMIGNDLLLDNDLIVATASYTNANIYKSHMWTLNHIEMFGQSAKFNFLLQHYNEKNYLGVNLTRISPSFQFTYQLTPLHSLEIGAGIVQTRMRTIDVNDIARNRYFNLGYHWNF